MAGIEVLKTMENTKAIAELMSNLPHDRLFGDLCCEIFNAIKYLDPDYFKDNVQFTTEELGQCLHKFSLLSSYDPYKVYTIFLKN